MTLLNPLWSIQNTHSQLWLLIHLESLQNGQEKCPKPLSASPHGQNSIIHGLSIISHSHDLSHGLVFTISHGCVVRPWEVSVFIFTTLQPSFIYSHSHKARQWGYLLLFNKFSSFQCHLNHSNWGSLAQIRAKIQRSSRSWKFIRKFHYFVCFVSKSFLNLLKIQNT